MIHSFMSENTRVYVHGLKSKSDSYARDHVIHPQNKKRKITKHYMEQTRNQQNHRNTWIELWCDGALAIQEESARIERPSPSIPICSNNGHRTLHSNNGNES
eukprot:380036_1